MYNIFFVKVYLVFFQNLVDDFNVNQEKYEFLCDVNEKKFSFSDDFFS